MLKANAIYRDGSKLSQPLAASTGSELFDKVEAMLADQGALLPETASEPEKIAERIVIKYMARRARMPHRRGGYTQKAVVGGHKVYL